MFLFVEIYKEKFQETAVFVTVHVGCTLCLPAYMSVCVCECVSLCVFVCVCAPVCPYMSVCVCRNAILLDFNHILPVGLQCLEYVSTDSYRQRVNKMRFQQYRQTEAEYFSVSDTRAGVPLTSPVVSAKTGSHEAVSE